MRFCSFFTILVSVAVATFFLSTLANAQESIISASVGEVATQQSKDAEAILSQAHNRSAPFPVIYSTGRLGRTDHSGHQVTNVVRGTGNRGFAYDADYGSAFAAVTSRLPKTPSGIVVTVGAFGGYSGVDLEILDDQANPGKNGSAEQSGFMGGVMGIASLGNYYVSGIVAGSVGEAEAVDDLNQTLPFEYHTRGVTVMANLGHRSSLAKLGLGPNDIFLDVSGGILYSSYSTDTFDVLQRANGAVLLSSVDPEMDSLYVTATVQLFTVIQTTTGRIRPFAKFFYRGEANYDSTVRDVFFGQAFLFEYDQDDHLFLGELGMGYQPTETVNLNASFYGETSNGDQTSVGARFGATLKLN